LELSVLFIILVDVQLIPTTMKYFIMAKSDNLVALSEKQASRLLRDGYSLIASCESKEKAQGMIMGIQVDRLVEKYASHLPSQVKVSFKVEMAQIATNMYNQIIK